MKLKYYLRGAGIGIVATTLVFSIANAVSSANKRLVTGTEQTSTESSILAYTQKDTQAETIKQEEETTKENAVSIDGLNGNVEFDHVSFAYPGADEDVLTDLDFEARPGETTAIIGSTGCGKSSLVQLMPRFYDVTGGKITIDGTDIRDVSIESLRENIGYVPQKGVLFSGTIASNIRFGAEDASDEQMKKAAAIAQATDFIEEKDKQYDSSISQGGTNVSGGQKQRLAIARAVARNAKIYIFDDSFSALDFKTDVAVRKALREDMTDSTVFIVAQRVSTILHADQILVLDEGKIVGKGTHKELMENCPVYEQIARSQLSEKEIAASIA